MFAHNSTHCCTRVLYCARSSVEHGVSNLGKVRRMFSCAVPLGTHKGVCGGIAHFFIGSNFFMAWWEVNLGSLFSCHGLEILLEGLRILSISLENGLSQAMVCLIKCFDFSRLSELRSYN